MWLQRRITKTSLSSSIMLPNPAAGYAAPTIVANTMM
jgi:hypothetical protein